MTTQHDFQSREDGQTVRAQHGYRATDIAEGGRTLYVTGGTGDNVLSSGHAKISLSKGGAKTHIQALQNEQDRRLMRTHHLAPRMVCGGAARALWGGNTRMDLISLLHQGQQTSDDLGHVWWREAPLPIGASLMGGTLRRAQQPFPDGSPLQARVFCQRGHSPLKMHQARHMAASRARRCGPAIMDVNLSDGGQDSQRILCPVPSTGGNQRRRLLRGRAPRHPGAARLSIQPGVIPDEHPGRHLYRSALFCDSSQKPCSSLDPPSKDSRAEMDARLLYERVTGSLPQYRRLPQQGDGSCPHARSIVYLCMHPVRRQGSHSTASQGRQSSAGPLLEPIPAMIRLREHVSQPDPGPFAHAPPFAQIVSWNMCVHQHRLLPLL